MNSKKGYYSLIQFCPDMSRLESVNQGVVLFCPDAGFLQARMAKGNDRASKLVGRKKLDADALTAAKLAIEHRFEADRQSFNDIEDLQRFVDTRGNLLRMTPPRPVKVLDPAESLNELFTELVAEHSPKEKTPRLKSFQILDAEFKKLAQQGVAHINKPVKIPVLGEEVRYKYAYKNGIWNFVQPCRFPSIGERAVHLASGLAIQGDLLKRHPLHRGEKGKLVVVTSFDNLKSDRSAQNHIQGLFDEYKVETVPAAQVDDFLTRVRKQAHS